MPKSLEQNKETLRLQRDIFLIALWIICFEPLIWFNVQRFPQNWMWHVTIDNSLVVISLKTILFLNFTYYFSTSIIACVKGSTEKTGTGSPYRLLLVSTYHHIKLSSSFTGRNCLLRKDFSFEKLHISLFWEACSEICVLF